MTSDGRVGLRGQSGFSLVELMTAVAIFGILIAAGLPHIDTKREDINSATKQIIADYRWARSRAITSGVHFSIKWNSDGSQYQVQRHEQVGTEWPVEEVVKTVQLPANINFYVWPETNRFNTRGMMVDPTYTLWAVAWDSKFSAYHVVSIWPSGQIYEEW